MPAAAEITHVEVAARGQARGNGNESKTPRRRHQSLHPLHPALEVQLDQPADRRSAQDLPQTARAGAEGHVIERSHFADFDADLLFGGVERAAKFRDASTEHTRGPES